MTQVIETDVLKSCPFCGGKAELKADPHPMNEAYTLYRVVCRDCQITGKVFLEGPTMQTGNEPSGFIAVEEAAKKATEAWNHRACLDIRTIEISDDMLGICIVAERAAAITDELQNNYFGDSSEKMKESVWMLTEYYDRARILSNISHDYAYQTLKLAEALTNKVLKHE